MRRPDRSGARTTAATDALRVGRPAPPKVSLVRGVFVVFEGGDGVGKSTQAGLLAAWLSGRGREVVRTFEPGDGEVNARIRAILLSRATHDLGPKAEALLFAADRAQHVHELIRPALDRGAVVVCDRYVDSTLAYQGAGRVLDAASVAQINAWATGGLVPDLTVLLDLDPVAALASARRAGEHDRIEAAGTEFHARVRQGFLGLAAAAPERYLVLPAREPVAALHEAIRSRVATLLDERADAPGRLIP